jgi:peptide/nickel transport system permease protein
MYPKGVTEILSTRLPYTLALVIPVLLASFFVGNWIGVKAAYAGGKRSKVVCFLSALSSALPSFWLAMVLVAVFAGTLAVFPMYGQATPGTTPAWSLGYFLDVLHHYALPFLTLFIIYLGGWITRTRSAMIHEMDSGHVRYGEQLSFKKSMSMAHTRSSSTLLQFTDLNLLFNALIGEAVLMEIIFGWSGIGKTMLDALLTNDFPLLFGGFLVLMVVLILGNFLIDILHGYIDLRIQAAKI